MKCQMSCRNCHKNCGAKIYCSEKCRLEDLSIREIERYKKNKMNTKDKKITVLSLFDGISVAQQALKELGYNPTYYSSEVDKYAISITQRNFPDTIQLGDIKNILPQHKIKQTKHSKFIPKLTYAENIDLMIGGFPCQSFSIAGKRKGFEDSRGQLVFEMLRIIKEVKPKYLLAENVASMKKDIQEYLRKEFEEAMGVPVYLIQIDAALVSAQKRKRIFFTNIPDITQPEDRGILLKDILEEGVGINEIDGKSITIKAQYAKNGRANINHKTRAATFVSIPIRIGQINKGGQGERIYSPKGKSVGLSALGGGSRGAKTGLYHIPHGYKKEKITQEEKYPTLHAQSPASNHLLCDSVIRKLTCVECERLMTLPDRYTEKGINEKGEEIIISNSQRYKTLGNSFVCAVITHILSFMRE